jgi:DMSO reductase anchor subunit
MAPLAVLPTLGIILAPLFVLYLAIDKNASRRNLWLFPALLSVAFGVLTVFAFVNVGPLGFWTLHITNLWGNQVWLDLLFAVSIAVFFALPQARAVGMNPLPWVIFTVCTGCVGLLAMTSRILYLRGRS